MKSDVAGLILRFWLLALLLVPRPSLAGQADELEPLRQFLAQTQRFQAAFRQSYQQAQTLKTATGIVYLQKPGKFRWEYTQPHVQLIVGDGQKIYVHDPDLNQVTVKRQDDVLGKTPALLLSGGTDLEQDFQVRSVTHAETARIFTLAPKDQENNFKIITLTLEKGVLQSMTLIDQFDQESVFRFEQVQINPVLAPALFQFQPAANMDVLGE